MLILVHEKLSALSAESQIVVTCEKFNRGFGASFRELQGLKFSFPYAFFVFFTSPSLD